MNITVLTAAILVAVLSLNLSVPAGAETLLDVGDVERKRGALTATHARCLAAIFKLLQDVFHGPSPLP